jgi:hypothetical protein
MEYSEIQNDDYSSADRNDSAIIISNYYTNIQMECPMCYDIYDEIEKIPRNLHCGHTYCEECLVNAIKNKGRL